jgi:Fe-S-cluster containining protein
MEKKKMSLDYPQNLHFRCVKCGICCGDTDERTRHILMLEEEANDIASATNQPIICFAQEISDKPPYRYEMKKTPEDGKCVFLRENRCLVYSKRPLICRFYPFGLKTIRQHRIFYYSNECPGIGRGKTMKENDFHRLLKQANRRAVVKQGKGEVGD